MGDFVHALADQCREAQAGTAGVRAALAALLERRLAAFKEEMVEAVQAGR
jgi:hypothetical protein